MSFLTNKSEYLAARLTSKGRQKIAEGDFKISYFQIGDSEYDYAFSALDGSSNEVPNQKVFTPLDRDSWIKYPYKFSNSDGANTTYGEPIAGSDILTIENKIGPAGFVSSHIQYLTDPLTGSTIICENCEFDMGTLDGTNTIQVPTGVTFNDTEYITMYLGQLVGTSNIIPSVKNTFVYKIIGINTGNTYNTLVVDRSVPDLAGIVGTGTIISNYCDPNYVDFGTSINCMPVPVDIDEQQDPWTLNIVWSQKPAGLDVSGEIDEELTGYTSNIHTSTKEFLGYNKSDGQINNALTTIVNDCGTIITVKPEEQHSLAIIHYNGIGGYRDPDKYFKYEDYISQTEEARDYFEIYIPFIMYHRNTGNTIGAVFHMDETDYYINSTAIDTKTDKFKFRYLLDEQNNKIGKILVNNKTIIIDDQEIIAALDYKTNRRYTLPIPSVNLLPLNLGCNVDMSAEGILVNTGQTMYISYLFEMSSEQTLNGMHCNYYPMVVGSSTESNVGVSFCNSGFNYMQNTLSGIVNGYIADTFKILVQIVNTGEQPEPMNWYAIDFTDEIPNHTVGNLINPVNMNNSMFVITQSKYDNAVLYDLEDYLGSLPEEPSSSPEFGDEQPFPGSIKLFRASDIFTMNFMVNLPSGQFETTQNPTWIDQPKKITEVALMNSNKEILVIAKTASPITRIGTQIIQVNLDF